MAGRTLMAAVAAPSKYLGLVATRCGQLTNNGSAGVGVWVMGRSKHVAQENIVNPTVIYGAFYVPSTNAETSIGGSGTIKASIEYPAGTFTQCNEGNIAWTGLTSLTFNISIPKGAIFWMRPLQQNASGIMYCSYNSTAPDPTDGFLFGTGAVSDFTNGGTITHDNTLVFPPLMILAQTRRPTVLIHGDSRARGANDIVTDLSGDIGDVARSIGKGFGYSVLATAGASLSGYLNSRTFRDQLAQYASHIWNGYGINDLNGGGQTAAVAAASRVTFAALYPTKVVVGQTLPPFTTSTDSFATVANQSVTLATVAALNALIRTGIAGEAFYYDLADAVDPLRANKWPVERSLVAASGTAGFGTSDGLHESAALNEIIRNRGAINLSYIQR